MHMLAVPQAILLLLLLLLYNTIDLTTIYYYYCYYSSRVLRPIFKLRIYNFGVWVLHAHAAVLRGLTVILHAYNYDQLLIKLLQLPFIIIICMDAVAYYIIILHAHAAVLRG